MTMFTILSEKDWGDTTGLYSSLNSLNAYGETRFYEDESGVIDNSREQFRANVNIDTIEKDFNVSGLEIGDAEDLYFSPEIFVSLGGTSQVGISALNFRTDIPLSFWRLNRVNAGQDLDLGSGVVKKDTTYSLVGSWNTVDWLNLTTTGTGEDLYLEITGTESTNYIIENVNSTFETNGLLLSDGSVSPTEEMARNKISILRRKNWFNVTAINIPENEMHISESISGYFNGNTSITIDKGTNFGNFFLVSQTIQPIEKNGGLMIGSLEEWASVGPWVPAPW